MSIYKRKIDDQMLKPLKNNIINYGVRIDTWTHFIRECTIELCTPI